MTRILYTMILIVLSVLVIQNNIYAQEAKFQQTSDGLGLVSMEAENYSVLKESTSGESYWEFTDEPADFSGEAAVQCGPPGYEVHKDITDGQENAPIMEYTVNFAAAGPLYVWARTSHVDGFDDSFWIGIDNLIEGTQPVSYTTDEQGFANEWYWISFLMDGTTRATLNIPSAGLHTVQAYMREPSIKLDKLVLVTDEFYRPDDDDAKGPAETLAEPSGIELSQTVMPNSYELAQNYPNPFNPATTIRYALPKSEYVSLKIFNLKGQEIASLVNTIQNAGDHQISWNAEGLPSGIYFYKLQAGEFSDIKKLILQK